MWDSRVENVRPYSGNVFVYLIVVNENATPSAGYSHQFTYQEDVLIPGALEVVFITDEWKKSFQTGIVFLVFKRAMRLEYRMIKFSKLWQLCKQATAARFFFLTCVALTFPSPI